MIESDNSLKKERKRRKSFLIERSIQRMCWNVVQPYGPRMTFDGVGLKQSIGLVNPIERFEVARKWRFLEEVLGGGEQSDGF